MKGVPSAFTEPLVLGPEGGAVGLTTAKLRVLLPARRVTDTTIGQRRVGAP